MRSRRGFVIATIAVLGCALLVLHGVGTAAAQTNSSAQFETPQLLQEAGQQLALKQQPPGYTVHSTEYTMTMSDGVQIASTLYSPQGQMPSGGWPAVVMIHGWGGDRSDYNSIAPVFAGHGIQVLTYDCRGFGQSTGQTGLAGQRDILDIYQLMTWLIQNAHVDANRIGLTGISYGGGQSILAAADSSLPSFQDTALFGAARNGFPPKVAAIAPIAGWTNLKYALFPNQVVKYSFDAGLYAIGDRPAQDNYPAALTEWLMEGTLGFNQLDMAAGLDARSIETDAQWQSLAHTPAYFFQAWKDALFPAEQVIPLFEQAAEDTSSPLYNQTAAANDRLYLGGYGHAGAQFGAAEGAYVFQQDLDFMQQQLMHNNRTGLSAQPKVGVAPENWQGDNAVQYTPDYPLPGSGEMTAYLTDGTLSRQPPTASTPTTVVNAPTEGTWSDVNVVPPADFDSCQQTLEQNAPPLSAAHFRLPVRKTLHVFGQPTVTVYVEATLPTAEITARLYDHNPTTGTWYLLSRTATMADHLSPAVAQVIRFKLFAANHSIPEGDELVLDLSPSDFPFFLYDKQPYSLVIEHDAQHPSQLSIPMVQ